MEIATVSGIATTTGVIRMIGALNGMTFATTATIAFGAGIVTIGKKRMIGGRAFVPMKTKQEVLQETARETMKVTETM